ncbi:bifunctional O-acetylhomoserine aminocarboxypropyltransferase/cysteine synthase [Xinfangfangia sp. D13-10-4-6]|uniref:O-acetylhomoserine aminocarboxypropyltransferase/cysteine synthase family protein n=1 Tax=Pseudogemmobacter hezensis TaxID=2737662 RepID=UPI001552C9A7|nr:PLP-dependent transferase [Pseudogemmobacter hezensis]NPD15192.1 bifunctional O-acetylhomoserine aminocarboxypropyltransferase/cysteine synthase [Pseudogemmobacter hezensis]
MATTSLHPETLALHGGSWRTDPATGSLAVPIYQNTSFQFDDTAHAARLFALEELGNIYSRIGNPTTDAFETRLAQLEGGAAALALASGQAATFFALTNLAQAGDNIVASSDLYGGTVTLLSQTLKQFGIEVRFVSQSDPQNFVRATDAKTRAWFGETLANPRLEVFPIAEVAALGREIGVPLILDNTASPLTARPLAHGAAVVVYSTTKYIGGHGTAIGGAIVDGGTFDWAAHPERFPLLTQPDDAYHGAIWTEAAKPLGPIAYVLRARVKLLRDIGASVAPQNAFLFLQGLETLPLRIRQHNENAIKVADYLAKHPQVTTTIFPGLQADEARRRADTYLQGGFGALVGFELKGGVEAGRAFIDALKLFHHVANIGDARSLAIHPSSTTHQQLTEAEQLAAGVTPGYVRLSIGLEHPEDIIADLDQALSAASVHSQGRVAA